MITTPKYTWPADSGVKFKGVEDTDFLENALAFAGSNSHEGDLWPLFLQAKNATRILAEEIKRLSETEKTKCIVADCNNLSTGDIWARDENNQMIGLTYCHKHIPLKQEGPSDFYKALEEVKRLKKKIEVLNETINILHEIILAVFLRSLREYGKKI